MLPKDLAFDFFQHYVVLGVPLVSEGFGLRSLPTRNVFGCLRFPEGFGFRILLKYGLFGFPAALDAGTPCGLRGLCVVSPRNGSGHALTAYQGFSIASLLILVLVLVVVLVLLFAALLVSISIPA